MEMALRMSDLRNNAAQHEDEKSARNAAYLARVDKSIRQMENGLGTVLSWEQLERIANGQSL